MLFTTPYMLSAFALSFALCVRSEAGADAYRGQAAAISWRRQQRPALSVIVGEVHHPKRREPAEQPRWLEIPERGLYTGTAIFGAIGSGKTSCCMYPFAQQMLGYRRHGSEAQGGGSGA